MHIIVLLASLHGNIYNLLKTNDHRKNKFCHIFYLSQKQKILKSLLVMHRIRKERKTKKQKKRSTSYPFPMMCMSPGILL